MSASRRTRRAIVRARFTEGPGAFLAFELVLVGAAAGAHWHSWPVAIGTVLALTVGIALPGLAPLIVGALSLAWCVLFVQMGWNLWGVAGVLTLGLLGSIVMIGVHVAGLEGLLDAAPSTEG